MEEETSGLRRSAIVLLSLGEQHAGEVLRRMSEEDANAVRAEMARVGKLRSVSLKMRQQVLGQFYSQTSAPTPSSTRKPQETPFSELRGAGADNLLDTIRDEHPQTIALVLSHLPPDQASNVLAGLDPQKKVEVVKRIVGIEQTSSEVIEQVEQSLRERLSSVMGKTVRGGGGISAVAEILNSADRKIEEEILREIEEDSPLLAEQIRVVAAIFEDLLIAPDHDIQLVIDQLDQETISLALRTARPELKEKVLWNMTPEESQSVEQELARVEPVAVSEIESAQQRVADAVHRLEAAGEIRVRERSSRASDQVSEKR